MKKIVLYIMTYKGYEVLKHVLSIDKSVVEYVVVGKDANIENDFSQNICNLCESKNISFFIRKNEPKCDSNHFIFAISWRWMIKHPYKQLIIFHDSLLPKYRGFAPLVNMLINGEEQIGVSAIFGANEYDRGGLIEQKSTKISYPMKIQDAIKINHSNFLALVENLVHKISQSKEILATPQQENEATYSIWRNDDDYYIDWSQSATRIKRFIDAVGFPYLGAKSKTSKGYDIIIEDSIVVEDVYCELRDVGKVIFVNDGIPTVICGSGLLKITKSSILSSDGYRSFLPIENFRIKFY